MEVNNMKSLTINDLSTGKVLIVDDFGNVSNHDMRHVMLSLNSGRELFINSQNQVITSDGLYIADCHFPIDGR